MDNIIKELKLQLGQKEVVLTMDEAKKLKEALDELFDKEIINVPTPYPLPYPVYPEPWHWRRPYEPIWTTTTGCTVRYDSNTSAMTLKVA